jgi:hypothetical protein
VNLKDACQHDCVASGALAVTTVGKEKYLKQDYHAVDDQEDQDYVHVVSVICSHFKTCSIIANCKVTELINHLYMCTISPVE